MEHTSSTTASPHEGGDGSASGTDFCTGHQQAQDTILFIFFGLTLGVLMKKFIEAFRIPVPYTVCLLLLGLAWAGLTTVGLGLLGDSACLISTLDPELLLIIFLPMLIFESAFSLEWHAFKGVVIPALILAVPGLLFSIFLTGTIVHYVVIPEFDWNSSFLLGTLLSATDPVAVVALLKELGGPHTLATLIESESLLNDGTAIVAFAIFSELASGVHLTGAEGVEMAFQLSIGGPALGLLWGVVTIFFIGRIIDDDLAEVTTTVMSAYLLFFVAEDVCEVSGVLALVTMGACFAAYGRTRISPRSEQSTHTFWRILTFQGNTLIFLFVGIVLVLTNDFSRIEGRDWGFVIVLWIFLYIIRALMVLVFALPLQWTGYPLTLKDSVIIVHGGLRGAVALALALIVTLEEPENPDEGLPQVTRDKTLFYAGGIAFLTLIINASTTGPILRGLGLVKEAAAQRAVYEDARQTISRLTLQRAKVMSKDKLFSMANWDEATEFVAPPTSLGKVVFKADKHGRPSRIQAPPSAVGDVKEDDFEMMVDPATGTQSLPEGDVSRSVLSPPPAQQQQQQQQQQGAGKDMRTSQTLAPPSPSISAAQSREHLDEEEDEIARKHHERTNRRMMQLFGYASSHLRRLRHRQSHGASRDNVNRRSGNVSPRSPNGGGGGSMETLDEHEPMDASTSQCREGNNKSRSLLTRLGRLGLRHEQRPVSHEFCVLGEEASTNGHGTEELHPRRSTGSGERRLSHHHSHARRRRPSTSHSADMQNARLRFLVSTRAIYWELFDSGFLDRDSVLLLVNASETEEHAVEHDSTRKLNDWNADLQRFVHTPWPVRVLRRQRWWVLDYLRRRLLRWYEIHHAAACVNVADAFTAAHRKVLGDLSGLLSEVTHSEENRRRLLEECFANMELSRMVSREFPHEVVSIVRTRQATSLLLRHQEEVIGSKFRHGIFTALEHDHLIGHIRKVRAKLVLNTASFHFPDEEGILRWSRLMEDLSSDDVEEVFRKMQIVTSEFNEPLVRKNGKCKGIYVILRGYACFENRPRRNSVQRESHVANTHLNTPNGQPQQQQQQKQKSHTDVLMAGRTLGVIETVAQHTGLVTIRTMSHKLQAAFFPVKAVHELFESVPLFKRNAYRLCAFQLCYLQRPHLFRAAGRVLPHARNIADAPFSVQEDLWPFAHAGSMEEMKKHERVALGVAGLVVSGKYRRIKESEDGSPTFHRSTSSVFHRQVSQPLPQPKKKQQPTKPHRTPTSRPKFNAGVSLSGGATTERRTGLPQMLVGKNQGGSTFDSDKLAIPQVTEGCEQLASMSDTYSNMLAAEHFHHQQMLPDRRTSELSLGRTEYVPFKVLQAGEYLCLEPGLIFAMGPTALRTPDVLDIKAQQEEETPDVHESPAASVRDRLESLAESDDGLISARGSVSEIDFTRAHGEVQPAFADNPRIMVDAATPSSSTLGSQSQAQSHTSARDAAAAVRQRLRSQGPPTADTQRTPRSSASSESSADGGGLQMGSLARQRRTSSDSDGEEAPLTFSIV
ncbi:Na+/H+ antiporter [Salpingoeca rosetta]|uniref:Na+/H+ antiporter n=1 Tax=Salpingoeca rosetta (strain ATCC 50818 / BSB-021) TaxID=946362 RepID=F2U5J5_SALR5|nr:Na+/H+ antiporter [Salpingoeca rosetta]EGD83211.1 Na+/H+ antiporter [Salpingoeca rosetta]|eukprot:XP_004995575.1 Na+/H+ antiporter [Salpingoeca rosetta]